MYLTICNFQHCIKSNPSHLFKPYLSIQILAVSSIATIEVLLTLVSFSSLVDRCRQSFLAIVASKHSNSQFSAFHHTFFGPISLTNIFCKF